MSKEIMSAAEVAEFIGYTRDYIYRLAQERRIPAFKAPGSKGKWFFDRERVRTWLAAGCPPVSEEEAEQ